VSTHPRYELLEKLASGSYATVYRGRDLELGREIAIKQIHEQYLENPQQLERYWQEAQLLASFQHPNIVTIYDVVRDRGWLILELMQSDLSRVAGRKQMDLNALRTTLAHCLRALKFLHAHGIVHGDIKPSNMMIDRRRRVKLGDFGLARRVSDEGGSLIKGTTKYMAPEVVSDEFGEVGPASDLYSLGFAAFELMCGENFESLFPGLSTFGRDRQMAWMMWHAAPDRRLPEISRVLEDVPADLARTIQKLIAKPQADRYRNADQALADLNIDVRAPKAGEESGEALGRTTVGSAPPRDRRRLLIVGVFALSVVLSLAALFLPGGDGTKPAGNSTEEKLLSGIVREVLVKEGKIVIEDERGIPEEIDVGAKPRIHLNEEQFILLRELKPDDRVEIKPPKSSGGAPRIVALRPVPSQGRLKGIDPEGSKLTVSVDADPHPQDVPMFVPAQAKLYLNGKGAKLADLLPDDRVDVTHLKDTQGRAARDVIRLDARRSMRLEGFVREVKTIGDRPWLVVDRLGVETPVEFGDDARISINGTTAGEESTLTSVDLKPGDRVIVTHDTRITVVDAERRARHTGVLLKVEPGASEILVRSDDGREATYAVNDESRIRLNDNPAKFDDLRKYDRLDVTYEATEGTTPAARTIDARRPKSP
jgi:eukaryotic-like serine/threonine-protein kinase